MPNSCPIHGRLDSVICSMGKKMSPHAGARGLKFFGKVIGKSQANPERIRILLLGLGFPGFDNILLSFVTKRGNRRLFRDFGTFFEDYRYKLSIRFCTIFNSDGFEALEAAERRTDVSFAPSSRYTGHPGNIGHVSHRGGREGHDGHGHGYN